MFYSLTAKNKKKGGDVSDDDLDDSKSIVSNATETASKTMPKPSKKKKGIIFDQQLVN